MPGRLVRAPPVPSSEPTQDRQPSACCLSVPPSRAVLGRERQRAPVHTHGAVSATAALVPHWPARTLRQLRTRTSMGMSRTKQPLTQDCSRPALTARALRGPPPICALQVVCAVRGGAVGRAGAGRAAAELGPAPRALPPGRALGAGRRRGLGGQARLARRAHARLHRPRRRIQARAPPRRRPAAPRLSWRAPLGSVFVGRQERRDAPVVCVVGSCLVAPRRAAGPRPLCT